MEPVPKSFSYIPVDTIVVELVKFWWDVELADVSDTFHTPVANWKNFLQRLDARVHMGGILFAIMPSLSLLSSGIKKSLVGLYKQEVKDPLNPHFLQWRMALDSKTPESHWREFQDQLHRMVRAKKALRTCDVEL